MNNRRMFSDRKRSVSMHKYYNKVKKLSQREEEQIRKLKTSSPSKKLICKIIKQHHKDLKDDPNRISTQFLQNLIGVDCQEKTDVIDAISRIKFV